MINAGAILKEALNKLGVDLRIKSYQIMYVWDKAVGPYISAVACPENVKSKTLFVSVRDNVWLTQLKFLEPMIIDKLNGTVGEQIINKIYFKLGEINQVRSNGVKELRGKNSSTHQFINSSNATDIDLSLIKDEDLRKIIKRVKFKSDTAVKET